jgi:hypothetical protein
MKILFSKKMAFVYGGLSICAMIGIVFVSFRPCRRGRRLELVGSVFP